MKYADCHPDRKHESRGFCKPCYNAEYRKANSDKIAERNAEYRKANSDKISEYHAEYHRENSEKIAERKAEYYKTNLDKIAEQKAEYYKINSDKLAEYRRVNSDKIAKRVAKYAKANPGKMNAKTAKRRAAKLQRTPKWADLEAIRLFYINCPEDYQVDHIIPLQGETVSGFHVLDNLRYLTAKENLSKGNKFDLTQSQGIIPYSA